MQTIAIIRKIKAWAIRLQVHRLGGRLETLVWYAVYLIRLSAWVHRNRKSLLLDDFYLARPVHKKREELYAFGVRHFDLGEQALNYLEFGVGRGNSMRWWTSANTNPDSRFRGFDTFEGLPERYGTYAEGTFSLGGQFPDIADSRIRFVKGLFQDTLPAELSGVDFGRRTVVHIDGDLYNSTLYPLALLYPHLKPGDLIFFDEFGVPLHEFRAYQDFTKAFRVNLKPIAAVNNYLQVLFEVQ